MILNKSGVKKLAQKISQKLKGGEIFLLIGDLGAGKTFFSQELGKELGANKIKSPTFVILHLHITNKDFDLAHFDFYRLNSKEIDFFEWSDYLGKSNYVSLIEWGERIKPKISQMKYFAITIKILENGQRDFILSNNLIKWLKN